MERQVVLPGYGKGQVRQKVDGGSDSAANTGEAGIKKPANKGSATENSP